MTHTPATHPIRLFCTLVTVILGPASPAAALQFAGVSTDFWDGVNEPAFCRIDETSAGQADVSCTATLVDGSSSGSSVVMATAGPGSLGASAYNGWIEGTDTYYGYGDARSDDDFTITGGPANGTVTVAVGAIVNGGLGIYGTDAAADARAYFRFQNAILSSGTTSVFNDRAYGEGDPGTPVHVYDYGVRNDYRYIDVMLDANGEGTFNVELRLDVSAFEEGDGEPFFYAAAADYGDTVNSHLQPWSGDFMLSSANGWETRPFGTPLESSPAPVTLTNAQLGIVPEPGAAILVAVGLAAFASGCIRLPRV